ncbi:MAG: hypothetical protein NZ553_17650 [Caldilinea sp.]|nr:hypothetical protein [Caldilinea sp.]MDW8442307.1 hypothetical protein [Caldilineaceae bacterium]
MHVMVGAGGGELRCGSQVDAGPGDKPMMGIGVTGDSIYTTPSIMPGLLSSPCSPDAHEMVFA